MGAWNWRLQTRRIQNHASCISHLSMLLQAITTQYILYLQLQLKNASRYNKTTVTFDQPLYIKACDIISSCPENSDLSTIIVRLGGFHLLMSFMGCIGYIMDGSGLKELFSVVYAAASVDKMLTGHAYARALRGHVLVHLALAKIVLSTLHFTLEEESVMEKAILEVGDQSFFESIEQEAFKGIINKFKIHLNKLAGNGATAKL